MLGKPHLDRCKFDPVQVVGEFPKLVEIALHVLIETGRTAYIVTAMIVHSGDCQGTPVKLFVLRPGILCDNDMLSW